MFRSIRRFLALAIASVLAASHGAQAGVSSNLAGLVTTQTFTTTKLPSSAGTGVLTDNTCAAITPVIHELKVLGAPTVGSGRSCTNDLQCNEAAGEACVFAIGATSGSCSASGYLSRENVHYVAGNLVDVEVTIPECTGVSRVQGVTLLGTSSTGGQPPVSWSFLPAGPPIAVNGQPAIRQRLRIQFSNLGDGTTGSIPIEVAARTGAATATRSFTLAGVAAVNAAMRNTVAETRIRNAFIKGVYDKFGDTEEVFEDGERIAYEVDWSELDAISVNGEIRWRGTDLRIQEGKLVFANGFRGDAFGCDPFVAVDGEFRLVPNGDGVDLEWIREPDAETDAPIWCAAITLGIWEGLITAFADEEAIAAPIAATLAASFDADENGHIEVCESCKVTDVAIGDGKIEIWTIPPAERVRVNVSATRGIDATASTSTALMIPAGFYAPIVGGGSFETCDAEDGAPAGCEKFAVDMDGAFNWWGTDVPVPNARVRDANGHWTEIPGRAHARERLRGVMRFTGNLPASGFPADSLIARRSPLSVTTPTSRARVSNGCVLPPIVPSAYRIALGVNDIASPAPTNGKLVATVLLAQTKAQSELLFKSSSVCESAPVSGGVGGTTTAIAH